MTPHRTGEEKIGKFSLDKTLNKTLKRGKTLDKRRPML